jgi:hypothetical protein
MIVTAFLMFPLLFQVSVTPAALPPEVLTNDHIMRMVDAGLSADVIEATIKRSVCNFHTDTDALITLAAHKVPDSVIRAMMACASAAAAPPPSTKPAPSKPAPTKAVLALVELPTRLPATFPAILYKLAPGRTCEGTLTLTEGGFEYRAVEECTDPIVVPWSAVTRYCYPPRSFIADTRRITFFGRGKEQWLFWTDDANVRELTAISDLLRTTTIPVREGCF